MSDAFGAVPSDSQTALSLIDSAQAQLRNATYHVNELPGWLERARAALARK